MNGFIKTTVAGLCLGSGLTVMVGCYQYRQWVDPCWPERYNAEARVERARHSGAQAHNGHVLDQTVWNYHFEVDPKSGLPTDRLNVAGMEHLKYLVAATARAGHEAVFANGSGGSRRRYLVAGKTRSGSVRSG